MSASAIDKTRRSVYPIATIELRRSAAVNGMIRQTHLWIGAWGAIAAILFGFTGFIQNHRDVLALPQGDSIDVSTLIVAVPEVDRASPERLRAWLRTEQHLDMGTARVRPGKPIEFNGQIIPQPARWSFSGGNVRTVVQVEYFTGAATLTIHTERQTPLAVMISLHKNEGGGLAWLLLEDSFALALIGLGISGLWMWARGRSLRQMVFSIVGVSGVLLVVIGATAIV
jgi:uncharacterized protein